MFKTLWPITWFLQLSVLWVLARARGRTQLGLWRSLLCRWQQCNDVVPVPGVVAFSRCLACWFCGYVGDLVAAAMTSIFVVNVCHVQEVHVQVVHEAAVMYISLAVKAKEAATLHASQFCTRLLAATRGRPKRMLGHSCTSGALAQPMPRATESGAGAEQPLEMAKPPWVLQRTRSAAAWV